MPIENGIETVCVCWEGGGFVKRHLAKTAAKKAQEEMVEGEVWLWVIPSSQVGKTKETEIRFLGNV